MISDGFVVSMVVAGILLAVLVAVIVDTWGEKSRDQYGMTDAGMVRGLTVAITLPLLIGFAIGLYPYEREHHWYESHTETIVAKDAATFNVNEDNEFRIELSNGITFRSDDYRFVALSVGDTVTVNCIRNWNYLSQDDYDCKFGAGPDPVAVP